MEGFLLRLPEIVIQLIALGFAIAVHESAHAWTADRLGDPTGRWLGRVSLNPLRHVDPIGTVLFPLLLAIVGAPVLGWAKPVPYVSRNLRNPRRDPMLVALAGPGSNVLLAMVAVLVLLGARLLIPEFRPLLVAVASQGALGASGFLAPILYLLFSLATINLVLAVFNLIPIPPLDGSHVLEYLLPRRWAYHFAQLRQYGMILLFALLWTGFFGMILRPFMQALVWVLLH
ncbi:MAG: site-2 protease family protein [Thermoanaerobaculum sp.]|nr:site-2 protease family protein [Thermoanaerobaculum sp.]MDW7966552.1 site-2 protease family protein [Thermoanaerobaculum sp.]